MVLQGAEAWALRVDPSIAIIAAIVIPVGVWIFLVRNRVVETWMATLLVLGSVVVLIGGAFAFLEYEKQSAAEVRRVRAIERDRIEQEEQKVEEDRLKKEQAWKASGERTPVTLFSGGTRYVVLKGSRNASSECGMLSGDDKREWCWEK